jgi:uncharacterized membrane protein YfcA
VTEFFLLIVFGFGVGVLVGTTGMGGGSLMTPLLIIVFGIKPVIAIGTDLAYAAVTKTVGGWRHFRKGTVDLGISVWLGVGSIPAAIAGVWVLDVIERRAGDSFDSVLLSMVATALLVTGVAVLWRAMFSTAAHQRERATIDLQRRHKIAAVGVGVAVGFVLGVTSAGSGALIAIALIMMFRLTPHRVVGTDVFHAAVLLWAASAAHLVSGNIDFALAGSILIGSVPGVWVGTHIAVRMPERGLRPALGIVLLASGLGLVTKAGVAIPAYVLVGFPVALAIWAWRLDRRRPRAAKPATSIAPPATPVPAVAQVGVESQ